MKQSPMPRHTKSMRPYSKKRAKSNRAVAGARVAFKKENPWCMCCMEEPTAHVHEMASGSAGRPQGVVAREAWLTVCFKCHRAIHETNLWPMAKQLAVKKLRDPEHYNRRLVNQMRGHAPDAITARQVRTAGKDLI